MNHDDRRFYDAYARFHTDPLWSLRPPSWFDYQDPEDAREQDDDEECDSAECEHGEHPFECTLCVLGEDDE